MNAAFYLAALISIFATAKVITGKNPVHALLYFNVSLLAVAMVFFTLGAHLAALLEIIIYAGAVIVLFVFVIMMLNAGEDAVEKERRLLAPKLWIGPSILAGILLIEFILILVPGEGHVIKVTEVAPKEVGIALFNTYFLGVELASMLLLAGLVGAYHLGKRDLPDEQMERGF